MTKHDCLKTLMLLSALESWAFAVSKTLPDYLLEDLLKVTDVLTKEILEKTE